MDHSENTTSNPRIAKGVRTIGDIVDERLSRRGFLTGMAATTGLMATGCATSDTSIPLSEIPESPQAAAFNFEEITRGMDETHHVPSGYTTDQVIRWGDPLFDDSPEFDPMNQSEAAQLRQFGYNNDYLCFVALPTRDDGVQRELLCVNH